MRPTSSLILLLVFTISFEEAAGINGITNSGSCSGGLQTDGSPIIRTIHGRPDFRVNVFPTANPRQGQERGDGMPPRRIVNRTADPSIRLRGGGGCCYFDETDSDSGASEIEELETEELEIEECEIEKFEIEEFDEPPPMSSSSNNHHASQKRKKNHYDEDESYQGRDSSFNKLLKLLISMGLVFFFALMMEITWLMVFPDLPMNAFDMRLAMVAWVLA